MNRAQCVLVVAFAVAGCLVMAQDSFESSGVKMALKLYDDCSSRAEGFTTCLKKKAVTFVDRLGRMDKLALTEGVVLVRAEDANPADNAIATEEQIDATLPRAADAKDAALTDLLLDKVGKLIGSRTLEMKFNPSDLIEEGRKKSGGGGGGGMKHMMGGMMMGMAAKMAAMVPIAIAGLFLLAGKALITAKIALLISGIIAIKKLFASKQGGGGGGGGHGWQSGGGGGGGWQSGGGGGGWDKRSLDTAQHLAYKAYKSS